MSTPHEFDTGLREVDLDPQRPRPIETPWGLMALYLIEGEVIALQAFCPHMEGPLFEGTLSDGTITCPWHRWCYDVRTGERLRPPAERSAEGRTLERAEVRRGESGTIVLRRVNSRG
jgi:nitrite reductase/ring-hydroxylating ferredoxin subunit